MTDEELKELVASLAIAQKETDRQQKETDRQLKETDRQLKETDRQFTQQIKELGKQIGGLGKKFGGFTEGLALPSMEKILYDKFHMEVVSPSVRVSKGGKHLEIDVLAYANSAINEVYVVEVKSHLREESLQQIKEVLQRFREFFPEHRDKKVFGILAAVDMSAAIRQRILDAGVYVARIRDEIFDLDVPASFQPKAY